MIAAWQYVHGVSSRRNARASNNDRHHVAFARMPAFAMVLEAARAVGGRRIVIAGAVIAFVGASRATIVLYGVGLIITPMLSLRHRRTGRKMGIGAAALRRWRSWRP